MKYNVEHIVSFGCKSSFKIIGKFLVIGHSNEHVVFFVIKPQFNKINFGVVMSELIFSVWIL